jgi:hypothetical protein
MAFAFRLCFVQSPDHGKILKCSFQFRFQKVAPYLQRHSLLFIGHTASLSSESVHSKENRKRATGHRNPLLITGVRSSANPKLLCHRHSLPMVIIKSSMMSVLDAPEVHPEKVKRDHRALHVREHPDDRRPCVLESGT